MIYQFENYDLKIKWDPKEKWLLEREKIQTNCQTNS